MHIKKNISNCAIFNPISVISKLGWYLNKLKNSNKMNVYNYEHFLIINWNCLCIINLQNFKQHLRHPYVGCKLCTHRYECMGTKYTTFTEEQLSQNLHIIPEHSFKTRDLKGLKVYLPSDNLFQTAIDVHKIHFFIINGAPHLILS